jgi:hypothetical protein
MYQFSTKEGERYYTFYSPVEIRKYYCFDCYDDSGNRKALETKEIDYYSFKFDRCFCGHKVEIVII